MTPAEAAVDALNVFAVLATLTGLAGVLLGVTVDTWLSMRDLRRAEVTPPST